MLKSTFQVPILLSVAIFGCAPVASSVPKITTRVVDRADGDLATAKRGRDLVVTATEPQVFPKESYRKKEEAVRGTHTIVQLKAEQVEALLEKGTVSFDLDIGVQSVEIVPMIELGVAEESFKPKKYRGLKLSVARDDGYPQVLWLSVSDETKASSAWTAIKKDQPSIYVAYKVLK
jgi:hypothetical protein